ncbi:MAG TPA: hypothetical protein PK772_03210 [Chitinophagaceae bacterium]|nr:hypothetical protein [Chitinophagaceae bacterium]
MKKTTLLTLTALVAIVCTLTIACKKSSGGTPTPPVTETPGPKFLAAKPVITNKCAGCHSGTASGPGNFNDNATLKAKIADIQTRINLPAGSQGVMPPSGTFTSGDKNTILAWTATGKITE